MDFNKGVISKPNFTKNVVIKVINSRSNNRKGIVRYINDNFFVELHDKELLPIEEECLDISNCKVLHSKPTYTTYCDWTPKPFDKVIPRNFRDSSQYKTIMEYWSKYYDKQIVYGSIVEVDGVRYFDLDGLIGKKLVNIKQ